MNKTKKTKLNNEESEYNLSVFSNDVSYSPQSTVTGVNVFAPNLRLEGSLLGLYYKQPTIDNNFEAVGWYVNNNVGGAYTKDEVLSGKFNTNFSDRMQLHNTFKTRFINHVLPMSNNQYNYDGFRSQLTAIFDQLNVSNYFELRYIAKGMLGTVPLYETETGDLILINDDQGGHTPYQTPGVTGNQWGSIPRSAGSGQGVATFALPPGVYDNKVLCSNSPNIRYKSLTFNGRQIGIVIGTGISSIVYKHQSSDATDVLRLYPISRTNTDLMILNMYNCFRIAAEQSIDVNKAKKLLNLLRRAFTFKPLVIRGDSVLDINRFLNKITTIINVILNDPAMDVEIYGFSGDSINWNWLYSMYNKYIKGNLVTLISLYCAVGYESSQVLENILYSNDDRSNISSNGGLPSALFNKIRYNSFSTSDTVMQWLNGSYFGSTIAGSANDNAIYGLQCKYLVNFDSIYSVYNRGFSDANLSKPSVHTIRRDIGDIVYDDGGGLMVSISYYIDYDVIDVTNSVIRLTAVV